MSDATASANGGQLPAAFFKQDREEKRLETKDTSSSNRARQPLEGAKLVPDIGMAHNSVIDATLTDMYQLTMAYGYWRAGKHKQHAVFDAFFRKCPFKGEYCILAGVDEVTRFLNTFSFTASQIDYLKKIMPTADLKFFDYL